MRHWFEHNGEEVASEKGFATRLGRPRYDVVGGTDRQAGTTGSFFSDAAIQFCPSAKVLFGLPLRQTSGMAASLLELADLDWPLPDLETMERLSRPKSCRGKNALAGSLEPVALNLLDLKAFGERIMARDPERQTAEIHIRIALRYRFSALGTAEIVCDG